MKKEPLTVASVQTNGREMRIFVPADPCEFANCSIVRSIVFAVQGKRKACIPVEDLPKLEHRGSRRLGQEVFLYRVSYLTDAFFGV